MSYVIKILSAVLNETIYLFNEMSPYLLLGFLIAGILHVILPSNFMSRVMGKANFASVLKAALLGVPLPLCSCGVIPTGVSLHKDGASKGAATSFLISTPQTGVDSLLVTYSMLGLPFAIIRPLVALLSGILGGTLVDKFTSTDENAQVKNNTTHSQVREKNIFKIVYKIFHYAFVELLVDIAKWLTVGLLVAALISALIPDDFFARYMSSPLLSMLIMLLVSIPFYVCSTGSVPIAAVLLLKGISPGAAFIFLMAGPATNAATITVVARSLGKKVLFIYIASIVAGSLVFALLMDYVLPPEWFLVSPSTHLGHTHSLLPTWLTYASSGFLLIFMLYTLLRPMLSKIFFKQSHAQVQTTTTTLLVKGMTCNHCKASVESGLRTIAGIKDITADIDRGHVSFRGDNVDIQKVKKIIDELGFKTEGLQ